MTRVGIGIFLTLVVLGCVTNQKNGEVAIVIDSQSAFVRLNGIELRQGEAVEIFRKECTLTTHDHGTRDHPASACKMILVAEGVVGASLNPNYIKVDFPSGAQLKEGDLVSRKNPAP